MEAVDAFRERVGLSTPAIGTPPGLVDERTVELLWAELERQGKAEDVRENLKRFTAVRR